MVKTRITGILQKTRGFTRQPPVLQQAEHSVDPRCPRKASRHRPPGSDLDDEQVRALLASPLCLQDREENAERSRVYHSERENLMSSSSQDPTSTGNPVALLSSKNRLNQETISDREDFPLRRQQVFGSIEPFFRFCNRQILRNLFLMVTEITCLLKRDLNSRSKNVTWILSTLAFVNFSGKLTPSGWSWRTPMSDMQNLEESIFDYRKNWS